jgi:hypothetical protein
MQIDESDEQSEKAELSIRAREESDGNVTVESWRHAVKHSSPMVRTELGMQIDESLKQEQNIFSPKPLGLEPDANVTAERLRQLIKQ